MDGLATFMRTTTRRDGRHRKSPRNSSTGNHATVSRRAVHPGRRRGRRLPQLSAELARQTGLGEAFVESLFIAITTSLPEIVVSLAAVRIGALDLGMGNVLGSNLFNLLVLGLDDIFYPQGPLMADAGANHSISIVAIVMMSALFLIGLTYKVMTKRFVVAWDTGAIAAVYVVAVPCRIS